MYRCIWREELRALLAAQIRGPENDSCRQNEKAGNGCVVSAAPPRAHRRIRIQVPHLRVQEGNSYGGAGGVRDVRAPTPTVAPVVLSLDRGGGVGSREPVLRGQC